MARILVIDDDVMLQRMLGRTLQILGHEVEQAFDGREGVCMCEASRPDVALTDILMPHQDGLQAIREMQRACPEVKIIAMSGGSQLLADMDALPFAARFGACRVLYKPFDQRQLTAALDAALSPPVSVAPAPTRPSPTPPLLPAGPL